jgi:3-hydroxyisobutyrate dehydrogenase
VTTVGFVGLGNMGNALATNLVDAGFLVVAYDAAGPERNVKGAAFVGDVAAVSQRAEVVVLSLPDGTTSELVARQLTEASDRRVTHVVDTSTIGPRSARYIEAMLADNAIAYVDAPVSGGVAGARSRTLTVMVAGGDDAVAEVAPVLDGLSDQIRRVGDRPGLAQAAKLANNFLSAIALAATSEAVAFGVAAGVELTTLLEVINASSGRNTATADKFPNQVVTERYASGFTNSLMAKDVSLYRAEVLDQGGPHTFGDLATSLWDAFVEAEPGVDFTRVYRYVTDPTGGK